MTSINRLTLEHDVSKQQLSDSRDIPFGPWPRVTERLVLDVTEEYEKMRAQLLLIRVTLGLDPVHDPVVCVWELYENGREAMEKMRGPKSERSASWTPRRF